MGVGGGGMLVVFVLFGCCLLVGWGGVSLVNETF